MDTDQGDVPALTQNWLTNYPTLMMRTTDPSPHLRREPVMTRDLAESLNLQDGTEATQVPVPRETTAEDAMLMLLMGTTPPPTLTSRVRKMSTTS